MTILSPFQLLEINIISAQDVAKVSRSMKTYAVAWVHPDRKLTTRVDNNGGTNPTWNDKFVFRVDNQFLQSDMSAIMIEIYALHWFRDKHVGTVRVLVGNLVPPQTKAYNQNHIGMCFVALQIRRRSSRPQGILNIGVAVLDSTMRSMPLYTQISAVGYQKLMGQDELHSHQQGSSNKSSDQVKIRRSKSDRSSILGNNYDVYNDITFHKPKNTTINDSDQGSMIGVPRNKKGGNFIYDKPLSIINGFEAGSNLGLAVKLKAQKGKKAESIDGYPTTSSTKEIANKKTFSTKTRSDVGVVPPLLRKDLKGLKKENNENIGYKKHNWLPNYTMKKDLPAGSIWSESEVGPSPSEVAAAIAHDSKYQKMDDRGSSIIMDETWSSINKTEGVRTKLERWRTDIPTTYDYSRSYGGSGSTSSIFPRTKHNRRHTATDGGGKFSCFSNICGYECSIVCGRNEGDSSHAKGKYLARAPSLDSMSTYL
ncbi:unnamed protein product [Amaranthus hypochondriacus]